jgi:hypothetical protein
MVEMLAAMTEHVLACRSVPAAEEWLNYCVPQYFTSKCALVGDQQPHSHHMPPLMSH